MEMNEIQALNTMLENAQIEAQQKEQQKANKPQNNNNTEQKQSQLKNRVEETLGINFKAPKYEIIYKQTVEASEVYGGFGQMTPSTMDSQWLVIRIQLPGEQMKNIDVELTEQTLTLFSKIHRLHLELPHVINEKSAKAKWNNGSLEITVRRKDVE
ncbi:Pre-RNA_processing PIH1/Nop17 family protein [Hexamita inflata]|uniref:Pre-RNA processing PIH1/Nop17 family protein n=1 Tax=Hexamita inflata TaxID=28002 RepID=A0AA86U3P6_9EUKA|nr:Pre-RNA processing PIH1/Nop17 family protein [Hexamita inflata]